MSDLIAEMKTESSRRGTYDGLANGVARTKMVGPNEETCEKFWEELEKWAEEFNDWITSITYYTPIHQNTLADISIG